MKLMTISGNTLREVIDKANALGVAKENIISTIQDKNGIYSLVYYGED